MGSKMICSLAALLNFKKILAAPLILLFFSNCKVELPPVIFQRGKLPGFRSLGKLKRYFSGVGTIQPVKRSQDIQSLLNE